MPLSLLSIVGRSCELAADPNSISRVQIHDQEEIIARTLLGKANNLIAHHQAYVESLDTLMDDVVDSVLDDFDGRSVGSNDSDMSDFNSSDEMDTTSSRDDVFDGQKWTMEEMKKLALYRQNHPHHSFSSIQHRFHGLKQASTMYRIIKIVQKGGRKADRMAMINRLVNEKFQMARSKLLPVHDLDSKRWGLKEAKAAGLTRFKASKHWVHNFKRKHRISYRRVTKTTTHKKISNVISIVASAMEFRDEFASLVPQFAEHQIFDTDQSGHDYEYHSTRTLSNTGEKDTSLIIDSQNSCTRSYTIQPILGYDGRLGKKLYVCLQEPSGRMGPIVEETYHRAPNLEVTCSSSSKLHKSHVKHWINVAFAQEIETKCLLISDSWAGQQDRELYEKLPNGKSCVRLQIPPGTTCIAQPLDVFFFRQRKAIVKTFYDHVQLEEIDIDLYQRDNVLKLQSLVHNQLSSDKFIAMGLYAWYAAGLREDRPQHFCTPVEVMFPKDSGSSSCSIPSCENNVLIRCTHCDTFFCFMHFFVDEHGHF